MVSVVSGMFEGYSGKIVDISEDKKEVTISVSTGTRDISVFVEAKDLRAVE